MVLPPFRDYRELAQSFASGEYDNHGWGLAWLGYSFISLAAASGNRIQSYPDLSPTGVLFLGIAIALTLGAAGQLALIGGFWLHLGARLFGGKEQAGRTIKLVGYALLWPGVLIFPAVVVQSYTFREEDVASAVLMLLAVAWHALLSIWAVFRAVNAARLLHQLPVWKAIGVWLWLPTISLAVVLLFFL